MSSTKTYVCELEVRGYELDRYEHVNHAVYLNYLEHARWKMLEQEGITLKRLAEWKRWPVVASIEARYLKPTFLGDLLRIETRIASHRRVGFEIEQKMFRGVEQVFTAKVGAVIVNEIGRPAEMPEEMSALWA